jgi:AcrR family transcriptional regulator
MSGTTRRPGSREVNGKPLQKRAEETRERILAAALECFSSSGFHGARVDEIAARARTNKERIYANFTDKEGLYAEVVRRAFAEIAEEEGRVAGELAGRTERLPEELIDAYLALHETHPHLWRLFAWENLEGARHAESLGELRRPAIARLRSLHAEWSRRRAKSPSFDAFFFTLTALTFFAFSNQATFVRTSGVNLRDPAVRRRLVRECLWSASP